MKKLTLAILIAAAAVTETHRTMSLAAEPPAEVSWIAGQSCPSDWTIHADSPTSSDLIYFSGPTGIFGNLCDATMIFAGTPALAVDPNNKSIELWFEPPPGGVCPAHWNPVCGLEGYFGSLPPGDWVFFGSFAETAKVVLP